MNKQVLFEAFDLRGDLSPLTFKQFLKYCADNGVSDVLVQGGDYIWVEIHGRQCKGSTHTIKQGQLSSLISSVWGADVESNIRSGKGADRSLEIAGEDLGIERGKIIRFRCNFIQGRVARLDEAYSITMRIIPADLPDIYSGPQNPDSNLS